MCWDEDASSGSQPSAAPRPRVAGSWWYSNWSNVLCAEHETWLCARRPGSQLGSELNGWAPVWQTDPSWAGAGYLQHNPALRPCKLGFEAESIPRPTCRWQDLNTEFESLERENASTLNLVMRAESYNVQGRIWEAEARPRIPRVTNTELRGYRRDEPGWIADRAMSSLVSSHLINRETSTPSSHKH
jgi:hypothetical protein